MENKNGSNVVGRRRVLQLVGAGLGVGVGATLLGGLGCKDKETPAGGTSGGATGTGALDCKSPIDENSKTLRRTLQYKAKADDPAKQCKACAQWVNAQYGECGGCKLIPGPVKAEGGCLSFAPIGGDAAAPVPG